jgi:reactive intermediate/imine deaminase
MWPKGARSIGIGADFPFPFPAQQSQAIKAQGLIFTSGQLPSDRQGNINTAAPAREQAAACIRNLAAVLEEAGSSLDKIIKTTVFLTDMKDFAQVNAVYAEFIKHRPARSCVAVKELPKNVAVEIECVALQ